jgi:hypothetical protein
MERDPQSTDRRTPAAVHANDRPSGAGAGAARGRPYTAIAAVVTIALLSALLFGALAARRRPDAGPGATGSVTPTVSSIATPTPAATPTPLALPAGTAVVSMAMGSGRDGALSVWF